MLVSKECPNCHKYSTRKEDDKFCSDRCKIQHRSKNVEREQNREHKTILIEVAGDSIDDDSSIVELIMEMFQ